MDYDAAILRYQIIQHTMSKTMKCEFDQIAVTPGPDSYRRAVTCSSSTGVHTNKIQVLTYIIKQRRPFKPYFISVHVNSFVMTAKPLDKDHSLSTEVSAGMNDDDDVSGALQGVSLRSSEQELEGQYTRFLAHCVGLVRSPSPF